VIRTAAKKLTDMDIDLAHDLLMDFHEKTKKAKSV